MDTIKVVGIAGSLRKDSFNRSLLRAALALAPNELQVEMLEIGNLPLYNFDIENSLPPSVIEFKNKIEAADAVLFVTPEYNYSVPGVLKNAIDWATRPRGKSSVNGKLAGIMGASDGRFGTARAQYHLRQILLGASMVAFGRPEVLVSFADKVFDAEGGLVDEETKKKLSEFLAAFAAWIRKETKN